MRTVFVLFDSLNRLALGCYGSGWIETPSFDRLAARACVFDKHYVGGLPCMPARRDLHSGRMTFMHRSWGPLEPFDNSLPQILRDNGVYSHLVSDHLHYFEDGGATYHTRYSSWDFIRGQEYDPWKAMVQPPIERFREMYSEKNYGFTRGDKKLQHMINREFIRDEKDFPAYRCFEAAFEFLDRNRGSDDWFLQLETFDPHEPFYAPERFRQRYATGYNGGILDWPRYSEVQESPEEIAEIRANYAALVAMCDEYLGNLLDYFDRHGLWDDTMLIVTTDHGFLLSEHDWWGKVRMPYYEEISHIPLIIHHPATDRPRRVGQLSQTPDLAPTFLAAHGVAIPPEMTGRSLLDAALGEPGSSERSRDCVVFGMFGGPIGVTDGRHAYYLYCDDLAAPGLYEYTLMPTHMRAPFEADEIRTAVMAEPFDFSKGMPMMRIDALRNAKRVPMHDGHGFADVGTRLFDLDADPDQTDPISDPQIEARMRAGIRRVFAEHDAPRELFGRYGLE